jgi:hypothetical protein
MLLDKMSVDREKASGDPGEGHRLGEGDCGDLGEGVREWAGMREHARAHRDVPSTDVGRRPFSYSRCHQRPICLTMSQSETPCRACANVSVIGASGDAKRDDCWHQNR